MTSKITCSIMPIVSMNLNSFFGAALVSIDGLIKLLWLHYLLLPVCTKDLSCIMHLHNFWQCSWIPFHRRLLSLQLSSLYWGICNKYYGCWSTKWRKLKNLGEEMSMNRAVHLMHVCKISWEIQWILLTTSLCSACDSLMKCMGSNEGTKQKLVNSLLFKFYFF